MINREVILAGCRAYIAAVRPGWAEEHRDLWEQAAATLAEGQAVPGLLTMTGPLLAALAAAVDADRHLPVTAGPGSV